MARIRTIKPEIASDKKLAQVSIEARYTFIMLITQADDDGLVRAEPRQLLGSLFPHDLAIDSSKLEGWIEQLLNIGVLRLRHTYDGMRALKIVKWEKHQLIKHRSKPFLITQLMPENDSTPPPSLGTGSGGSPEPLRTVYGEPTGAESRALSPESGVESLDTGDQSTNRAVDSDESTEADAPTKNQEIAEEVDQSDRTRRLIAGRLMPLVRRYLYAPDFRPPAGWNERREVSLLMAMLRKGISEGELADAIEGLPILRDSGEVEWLKPGQKLTLRAIYYTKTGVLPALTAAQNALDKVRNKSNAECTTKRSKSTPGIVAIGDLLAGYGRA